MDLTLTKDCAKAVAKIRSAIESRNTLPILSHVLLTTVGETRVALTGTNLTTSLRLEIPAEVKAPGSIALPGQKLAEITHSLPPAPIQLHADAEHTAHLTCERAHFRLKGVSPDEFPAFPQAVAAGRFSLPTTVFAELVHKTSYAVCTDQARYTLTGLSFTATAERIRLIGTNGHRLALASLPHANGDHPLDLIVPPKALTAAARFALDAAPEIEIAFTENQSHLVLIQERLCIATCLIDGTYPNVDAVIPTERERAILVNREALRDAIHRVEPILGDHQGMRFAAANGTLTLSAVNPNLGEASDILDAVITGDPPPFWVQPRYLSEFLDTTTAKQVQLFTNDPLQPILVQPVGDPDYTYIVMPIRGE